MENEDPEGHAMSQLAKLYSEAGKKALAAQYYLKVLYDIYIYVLFWECKCILSYIETTDFISSRDSDCWWQGIERGKRCLICVHVADPLILRKANCWETHDAIITGPHAKGH